MIDLKPTLLIVAMAVCLTISVLNFFTTAAVLPDLIDSWNINNTQAGWLVGVYFVGYLSSVLFIANLTDKVDARRIFIVAAFVSGLSSISVAFLADGFWLTILLRFLGGIAFAGVYMPGLRALTDQLPVHLRNQGVVYYTSCFALGTGLSLLAAGRIAELFHWRWAFAAAGIGAFFAMMIAAIVLLPRPPTRAAHATTHGYAYKRVWKNRKARAYILAMFGVGWEVFAFRTWIITYLSERQANEVDRTFWFNPSDIAFLTAFLGIPISMLVGELAARYNRERLLMCVALASFLLALSLATAIANPTVWSYEITILLCFGISMTSFGRGSATTAGMMNAAEDEVRGATMAAFSFVSFLSGIVSPLAFGMLLDLSGLMYGHTFWAMGFLVLAVGSAISTIGLLLAWRDNRFR